MGFICFLQVVIFLLFSTAILGVSLRSMYEIGVNPNDSGVKSLVRSLCAIMGLLFFMAGLASFFVEDTGERVWFEGPAGYYALCLINCAIVYTLKD